VTAGDILASARMKYGVPSTSNRWNDANLLQALNDACDDIAKEVDFPEATIPITTVAGVGMYPCPDVVKLLRCYLIQNGVFGTPLPGTDIPTLEGDILQIYDQSSGEIQGAPTNTPQFMAEQPQNYPLTNSPVGQSTVPTALPYFSVTAGAQRGMCFLRGGYVCVVPAPAASGLILAVDAVPLQTFLTADGNMMIYPRVYREALAQHMCKTMAASDRSPMLQVFEGRYQNEVPGLRTWHDNILASKPKRFVPITKRALIGDGWGYGGGGRGGSW
jgi:hypothetical protein